MSTSRFNFLNGFLSLYAVFQSQLQLCTSASNLKMDYSHFAKFDTSAVTYKVVNGHPEKAYVLTLKDIPSEKHPVAVKLQGGFFASTSLQTLLSNSNLP